MYCIYKITNKLNGMLYVGETSNFQMRVRDHINCGKRGYKYKNRMGPDFRKGLYTDMRKLGIENFEFKILENCAKEERLKKEKYWIEKLNSYENGYNDSLFAGVHGKCEGVEKTTEHRKSMSENHADVSGGKNPRAISVKLININTKEEKYFPCYKDAYIFLKTSKYLFTNAIKNDTIILEWKIVVGG